MMGVPAVVGAVIRSMRLDPASAGAGAEESFAPLVCSAAPMIGDTCDERQRMACTLPAQTTAHSSPRARKITVCAVGTTAVVEPTGAA